MQKPAGRSLLQEWRKLSQELHGKGVGKGTLVVPCGEHVSLSNISDEGHWIESKHGGEAGEQQKEKPVKYPVKGALIVRGGEHEGPSNISDEVMCEWCAEKSMEKHGEHMKDIQKLLLKRRAQAAASPLKRTNGVAAHEDKSTIIFEGEVETKRMKKQVSFAGVTNIVQVTDTACSKSFKKAMQTAGRSN